MNEWKVGVDNNYWHFNEMPKWESTLWKFNILLFIADFWIWLVYFTIWIWIKIVIK